MVLLLVPALLMITFTCFSANSHPLAAPSQLASLATGNINNTSSKNGISFSAHYLNPENSFAADTIDVRPRSTHVESSSNHAASKPFPLRILPLGASITFGLQSSDGNGYRKALRDQLRWVGWEVDMVGSVPAGNMVDNDCEGHPGARVAGVADSAEKAISYEPNLILINAGTNDAKLPDGQYDTDKVAAAMNTLLDRLFDALPDVTIILSTLLTNTDTITNSRVKNLINPRYRDIVRTRKAKGQRIEIADMYVILDSMPWISASDLADGTHPNDGGYRKMASVWWTAFQKVDDAGMLKSSANTSLDDAMGGTIQCDSKGEAGKRIELPESGSGTDDGDFEPSNEDKGIVFNIPGSTGHDERYQFAHLVKVNDAPQNRAFDDLVWSTNEETWVFVNQGNGDFRAGARIDVKSDCMANGARWGDVNNDGLDDFICIANKGDMYVSINRGGDPPTFEDIGMIMSGDDLKLSDLRQDNVRLGDIDGDGRLDYCVISSTGLQCWRNGGQKEAPIEKYQGYWEELGTVISSKGVENVAVRLADLNGDGRADFLSVDDHGEVKAWINNPGSGKNSLAPYWHEAGVVFNGGNDTGLRETVQFGRVYGHGKSDYIRIESLKADGDNGSAAYIHTWVNNGKGGALVKAEGTFFCDMHGTGFDDYVWIDADGRGFLNGTQEIFDTSRPRQSLHLADFDGDGKCDIFSVRESDGAAEVWQNSYDEISRHFIFKSLGFVVDNTKCTQGWGARPHDHGVRFADLDGDKRADYLCIEPDGTVSASLNKGINKFNSLGQVKATEHFDRADLRFVDVNNDGRADMLWVDKFSGDASVWLNGGQTTRGGSAITWKGLGKVYSGPDRGMNVEFANIFGEKRAGIVQMIPKTNQLYAWYGQCNGVGTGGDDGNIADPHLPQQPWHSLVPST